MTLFRGYGGDLPLMRWLQEKIWPVEAKLEAEDVYWGTRLACVEMIRTGTDPLLGHVLAPRGDRAGGRATPACGRRSAGRSSTPARTPPRSRRPRSPTSRRRRSSSRRDRAGALPRTRSTSSARSCCAGPPSPPPSAACRSTSTSPRPSRRSRTASPPTACGPPHYLDRLGLLGERTVLAHGVWLDRSELELIAERGCTVVTNPVANMKLAVGGVFPYPAAREAGRRGRARHRRRRLQRLARPARRPQGLRARPAPRGRRRDGDRRRRGLGDRHRRRRAAARRRRRSRSGEPADFLLLRRGLARARPRRPRLRPRLRGVAARSSTRPWSAAGC